MWAGHVAGETGPDSLRLLGVSPGRERLDVYRILLTEKPERGSVDHSGLRLQASGPLITNSSLALPHPALEDLTEGKTEETEK